MTSECGMFLTDDGSMCSLQTGHMGPHGSPAFRDAEQSEFLARKHEGKRPYASKAAAKRAAGMTSATFGGAPKQAYRCPVCDHWHVGAAR